MTTAPGSPCVVQWDKQRSTQSQEAAGLVGSSLLVLGAHPEAAESGSPAVPSVVREPRTLACGV